MADSQTQPSRVIDARGHRCPTPSLRLRRALAESRDGDVVALWADDPMAKIDIPHLIGEIGDEIVFADLAGPHLVFWVRKVRQASMA
jgi:tRNA 2-thiouridine synthesizing protein A